MATSREKLASFAAVNTATSDFRIAPVPKLYELMKLYGFKEGPQRYDEAMTEWAQRLERDLNERIKGQQPVSPGNG